MTMVRPTRPIIRIAPRNKIYASVKFSLKRYGHLADLLRGIIHTAYEGQGYLPPVVCEIGKRINKTPEDTSCSNLDAFSRIYVPYLDMTEQESPLTEDRKLSINAKEKYIAISLRD